jgi:hypothetical protein
VSLLFCVEGPGRRQTTEDRATSQEAAAKTI